MQKMKRFERSLLHGLASASFEKVSSTMIEISSIEIEVEDFDLLLDTFVRISSVVTRGDLLPSDPALHGLAFGVIISLLQNSKGRLASCVPDCVNLVSQHAMYYVSSINAGNNEITHRIAVLACTALWIETLHSISTTSTKEALQEELLQYATEERKLDKTKLVSTVLQSEKQYQVEWVLGKAAVVFAILSVLSVALNTYFLFTGADFTLSYIICSLIPFIASARMMVRDIPNTAFWVNALKIVKESHETLSNDVFEAMKERLIQEVDEIPDKESTKDVNIRSDAECLDENFTYEDVVPATKKVGTTVNEEVVMPEQLVETVEQLQEVLKAFPTSEISLETRVWVQENLKVAKEMSKGVLPSAAA